MQRHRGYFDELSKLPSAHASALRETDVKKENSLLFPPSRPLLGTQGIVCFANAIN